MASVFASLPQRFSILPESAPASAYSIVRLLLRRRSCSSILTILPSGLPQDVIASADNVVFLDNYCKLILSIVFFNRFLSPVDEALFSKSRSSSIGPTGRLPAKSFYFCTAQLVALPQLSH